MYVSIPLDDWDKPALGDAVVRTASSRYSPDPERLAQFAETIQESKSPVLLYRPEIERACGWDAGIEFAERLRAPVYVPSNPPTVSRYGADGDRAIDKKLRGHDLIIVVGAQIFWYYPSVPGDYVPEGAELLQITNDPYDAAAAIIGDSLLADAKLALEALIDAVPEVPSRPAPAAPHIERITSSAAE